MLNVSLIEYTAKPQNVVAMAAKLCYSGKNMQDLKEEVDSKDAGKFVEMLREIGHESPLEHVSFTFGVEGISRACLAQLTRHRIASFNVQSQRYVGKEDFLFVMPPSIERDEEAKEVFLKAMQASNEAYKNLTKILKQKSSVADEKAKEKSAIEDARYVLPNACETRLMVTMNARELLHFFELRCCNRAQWEIRGLAFCMLKLVKKVAPQIFKSAGPRCVQDSCKEGKMSCGQMAKMREIYNF